MNKLIWKKIGLAFSLLTLPLSAAALPTAKATLLVKDENGKPLSGVNAGLGFRVSKSSGAGSQSRGDNGITDENGLFTGSGATQQILLYGANSEGYYNSHYKFSGLKSISGMIGFRRWQPWNPTLEVVLKKIKNPIAMYAYHADWDRLPKLNEAIGYDLVEHDWVIPYGSGTKSDFVIKLDSNIVSDDEYRVEFILTFSSPFDGIQTFDNDQNGGSTFKSAHLAPDHAYLADFSSLLERGPNKTSTYNLTEGRNYYFRIRCGDDIKEDTCLYGKIYEDIDFGAVPNDEGKDEGIMKFTYYLNPTPGDRNMEFDPDKNLFEAPRGYEIKAP